MGGGALVVALLLTGPVVTFEWQEPAGTVAPEYYEVEFTQEKEDPEILKTDEPIISLVPMLGRSFCLRVRACLGATCGTWSELSQTMSLNRTADFNGDGVVGIPDFFEFRRMIIHQQLEADLNGDAAVGIPDYIEFAEHYSECVGTVEMRGEPLPAYVACRAQR